ncbi:MAG: TonB-dependent receptor [Blastocatellia bacterium]|nr:TonB-dependent receptor [Blastocatellia bacterium]
MLYQLFDFVQTNNSQRRAGVNLFAQRILILGFSVALAFQVLTVIAFTYANETIISGRVLDQNGAAVSGAAITLRQKAGGFERVAVSDDSGLFRFSGMIEGDYHLSVSRAGFSTFAQELKLSARESRDIEVTLKPGTISEKVTVVATRTETVETDTPVPVSVIERTELERRAMNTIGDLFRYLPGTSTVNEGSFQVRPRIRGLDSNRVLVLVDGERLNNTRTSTSNSGIEIGLVDVDQIESVEVARGSGSVLYGTDALGGTINIITRDTLPRQDSGFRFGGGFNGFFSSNEMGRRGSAYLTGAGSRFAFRVAQTMDRFDNYHSGPVPTADGEESSDSATEVPNSQYHGRQTQLTGRFFLNDFHSLKTSYERRRAANIGVPGVVGVFTAFFPFSNRDKVNARYEGYNLTPYFTRLSANVYYQQQDRNFSNTLTVPAAPPFFPGTFQFSETVTKTETVGFDLQSNWVLDRKNILTAGASYFRDRNRDSRIIDSLLPDFSTFPPSLARSVDNSKSVPDATFGDLAFFALDEYQPTRWLRFIGGVRVDRFDINSERTAGFDLPPFFTPSQIEDLKVNGLEAGLNVDDTAVSGDFGVVVKPVEEVSLTARVGRSFREPNLFERFFTDFGSAAGFVVGNPDLKPESGVNLDTGIKIHTARFAGSFTYFNNTYTNFLTSRVALDRDGVPITVPTAPGAPPTMVFQTVNAGRTRIQGIEAEAEAPLLISGNYLTLFGSLSYLRGDDLQDNVPLDFITPLKTVAGLRWQDAHDRFWSEYGARIVHKQERLSPEFLIANGGAEPGFVTHDLRGGINFRRERYRLGFTAALTNLGNRFYNEQFVFAPARGRSATVGVNLRFF